jgi:Ca-activated chloride channel family protein
MKKGEPVEGLGPDAFVVREDGRRREILRVSRATEPLDVALIVDNSQATADEISFIRDGVSKFIAAMGTEHRIALIGLAERPTALVQYTTDKAQLADGAKRLFSISGSGMTLLDALYETSRGLRRRDSVRAAFVPVVTDGTRVHQPLLQRCGEGAARIWRSASRGNHRPLPLFRRALDSRTRLSARRRAKGDGRAAHPAPHRQSSRRHLGAARARVVVAVQRSSTRARIRSTTPEASKSPPDDRGSRFADSRARARGQEVIARLLVAVLGLAVLGGVAAAQQERQPQSPAFRAGIDIVSLSVTVTDGVSHYVTDLDEPDFQIFEDGIRQEVTFFSKREQPIAMSLLLDSSASMEDKLPTLQAAAGNFVRKLKPNDIAQVIDFDSRVEVRQNFTGNQSDLQKAIDLTAANGSTSLHNAIYIALKELRKVRAVTEQDIRRQALVVFSDGEDTSSLVSFDEVLDLAKRSETSIYAIALRGPDVQQKGFKEAEFVMKTLALETGGRSFFPEQDR